MTFAKKEKTAITTNAMNTQLLTHPLRKRAISPCYFIYLNQCTKPKLKLKLLLHPIFLVKHDI